MKLRNFRTFLAICGILFFGVYLFLWKFSEKPVYSIKVNIPKAFNLNFTDEQFKIFCLNNVNAIPISTFEKFGRNCPIFLHNLAHLIVSLENDKKLKINSQEFGNLDDTTPLSERLSIMFTEREIEGIFEPNSNKILKAVIIKAPLSAKYGDVAKVIDAVKSSGADPIILQIDDLPE